MQARFDNLLITVTNGTLQAETSFLTSNPLSAACKVLAPRVGNLQQVLRLEVEFASKLNGPRLIRCSYTTEVWPVAEIGVRQKEVGMVERVEHFHPELHAHVLVNVPPFLNAHIPIEVIRAMDIREEPGALPKVNAAGCENAVEFSQSLMD